MLCKSVLIAKAASHGTAEAEAEAEVVKSVRGVCHAKRPVVCKHQLS